ncbi:MAG: exo-alpha-sialidase, partial [Mycobacterium sp.]|nr:exo-alpha-sialidase [Mycobacterium sp.]
AGASVVPRVGAVSVVSRGCRGFNAEAEQAVDGRYVYEVWIGCGNRGGIGFARSVDGGRHFGRPMRVPGSVLPGHAHDLPAEGWDPAIAVAPDGAVYVSFMIARRYAHPVVAVSVDHGATFTRVSRVMPPARYRHDLGDRDFIAVAPNGVIYLDWIYGPRYHPFGVTYTHPVIQKSTDGGRTWSRLRPVSPGFPGNGAASAPLVVEPSGQIDVLLWVNGTIRNHRYVHSPDDDYFTSSVDGGSSWSRPVRLGPPGFRINARVVFWIDADIGIDAGGVLYATWDTQRPGGDIGWLSYSFDHGLTWSAPRAATISRGDAEHIMAVAGGRAGIAYVGWETNASNKGWAQYLRPFSIHAGWLSAPVRISPKFGNLKGWPGDTIGLSVLPGAPGHRLQPVMVSWGVPSRTSSQIWAARVRIR